MGAQMLSLLSQALLLPLLPLSCSCQGLPALALRRAPLCTRMGSRCASALAGSARPLVLQSGAASPTMA